MGRLQTTAVFRGILTTLAVLIAIPLVGVIAMLGSIAGRPGAVYGSLPLWSAALAFLLMFCAGMIVAARRHS